MGDFGWLSFRRGHHPLEGTSGRAWDPSRMIADMERRNLVQAVVVLAVCYGAAIGIYFKDHDVYALVGMALATIVGLAIFFMRRRRNRL